MSELGELFDRLVLQNARTRRFQNSFPLEWRMLLITQAPVFDRGGAFDLRPDWSRAPKSSWRWIIAAREALFDVGDVFGCFDPDKPMAEIVDLVAVSLDLSTVTGRMIGVASVLGLPCWSDAADAPVRVFATPRRWLRAGCKGVVLVGDPAEQQQWLRGCQAGLIADSVDHAEALRIKLRRDVPALPRLLVAA